jgi:hypothetical protein
MVPRKVRHPTAGGIKIGRINEFGPNQTISGRIISAAGTIFAGLRVGAI